LRGFVTQGPRLLSAAAGCFSWLERGFNPQFRIILIIGIPLFTAATRAISCLENGKRLRVSTMTRRAKSKLFDPSAAHVGI
jgi:hypothetical protein